MAVGAIAPLVMGAQAIGGVLGAVGSIAEGNANRQAALYQAGVARQQAQFAEMQGSKEAERKLLETGQVVAEQRVAAAANGVDVNSGSAYGLQTSARMMGEADAQTIRENARQKANSYATQSQLYNMEADNARRKGWLDAFGSILGSATSVGSTWMDFSKMGVGSMSAGARQTSFGQGGLW